MNLKLKKSPGYNLITRAPLHKNDIYNIDKAFFSYNRK